MFTLLLTIILLVYGFINIPLVNQMASPFLAFILIYFLWKDIHNQAELKNELADIKKLLTEHEIKNNEDNPQDKNDDVTNE